MHSIEGIPAFYQSLKAVGGKTRVRVLCHNVFWFQGAPFAPAQPPDPRHDIMEKLCNLYQQIKPDILCLQELQSEETAQAVAKILDMDYLFCRGGNLPQYGGAIFSSHVMRELALPQKVVPDRIALGAEIHFESGRILTISNTHLPSNRQRGPEGGEKQRLRELAQVCGKADIILGDFNETVDGQCAAYLEKNNYVDAAKCCSAESEGSAATTNTSRVRRGDRIWIAAHKINLLQGYFVVSSEKLATDIPEKKFLSDHLPVGVLLY